MLRIRVQGIRKSKLICITEIIQNKKKWFKAPLYLEAGIIPARFQVQRQVLNLLHYIAQQPKESLLYKVYKSLENHKGQGKF